MRVPYLIEEHQLQVSDNKVFRKIFGHKKDEVSNLYYIRHFMPYSVIFGQWVTFVLIRSVKMLTVWKLDLNVSLKLWHFTSVLVCLGDKSQNKTQNRYSNHMLFSAENSGKSKYMSHYKHTWVIVLEQFIILTSRNDLQCLLSSTAFFYCI
jgi:hypothetical protein